MDDVYFIITIKTENDYKTEESVAFECALSQESELEKCFEKLNSRNIFCLVLFS